jgi:molybdopterin-guanine dinucleotide biosynthesis protein A
MSIAGAGLTPRQEAVAGLVLAGGRARRMSGIDKGLIEIAGRPMIDYVLERLRPQVGQVLINANRNPEIYNSYGHPVVADALDGFLGPLAGVSSALRRLECPFLLTVPCDTPLLPGNLAVRMLETLVAERADVAVAHDGQRLQPVFLLLRKGLAQSLERYLAGGGRKIDTWLNAQRLATVDFSDHNRSFINVNDPVQLRDFEARLLSESGTL